MLRDRQHFLAEAGLDGLADSVRKRRLELRGHLGEGFDLAPGSLERGLYDRGIRSSFGGLSQALVRPLDRDWIHGPQRWRTDRMRLSELDYALPTELIAQRPLDQRDHSRLLVYERATGEVRHRRFSELPDELVPDELAVVNDTRVLPARIRIERPRGEVLLLEKTGDGLWQGLARPTKRLRVGRHYGPVELVEHLGEGRWLLRLEGEPGGEMPLPPYITEALEAPERYQTVYAQEEG